MRPITGSGTLVSHSLNAEVVTEFGLAILLECLGYTTESDRGGAFAYLRRGEEAEPPRGLHRASGPHLRVCRLLSWDQQPEKSVLRLHSKV